MASIRSTARMFGGLVKQFCHDSKTTKVPMNFSIFLPPTALTTDAANIPVRRRNNSLAPHVCIVRMHSSKDSFQHLAVRFYVVTYSISRVGS